MQPLFYLILFILKCFPSVIRSFSKKIGDAEICCCFTLLKIAVRQPEQLSMKVYGKKEVRIILEFDILTS